MFRLLDYDLIRVEARLYGSFRLAVLDRVSASASYYFLRNFYLYDAAGSKCKGACIGHQARAKIGRIALRRGLAVYSKGGIYEGVYKGIAYLYLGSEGYDSEAATNLFVRATKALRWSKVRVRCVSEVDLASQ